MPGLFITFEGTEGSGKSTQIALLAERLKGLGCKVSVFREPGGTSIGEEIRHTLKHSASNHAMTPETELLLMNASRAQLVRERIRPLLCEGEIVLCDRFADSTTAYQAYGRQLNHEFVQRLIDFAIGGTLPDLTFFLRVPLELSESRRKSRAAAGAEPRDRMEEADPEFFRRVEQGYDEIASRENHRIRTLDATGPIESVREAVWKFAAPLIEQKVAPGEMTFKSLGEWETDKLSKS